MKRINGPLRALALLGPFCALAAGARAQAAYEVPPASVDVVAGIPIAAGTPVGEFYRHRVMEFDNQCTCDGKPQRKKDCELDPNSNHVLLKLAGGVIFFDAKLDIDNDGSPYAQRKNQWPDQPDTSLRYDELKGHPSLNADAVPYIVLPRGGFVGDPKLNLQLGDVAAVVYKDKRVFAIVGDEGPKCKIGEGSIELHERLGNPVCLSRNSAGECTCVDENRGIDENVLFFVFPGSSKLILPGLTQENINERINRLGACLFDALKTGRLKDAGACSVQPLTPSPPRPPEGSARLPAPAPRPQSRPGV